MRKNPLIQIIVFGKPLYARDYLHSKGQNKVHQLCGPLTKIIVQIII